MDQSGGLLGLHAEVAMSDLTDVDVVHDLVRRIEEHRRELVERREQLEARIRQIQEVMLTHYSTGAASVDDWLV
jgi:hypothetical protein